jgi:hypothetical protein
MAKPAADGVREVTLPVSLQDRVVRMGPFALLKLPRLAW